MFVNNWKGPLVKNLLVLVLYTVAAQLLMLFFQIVLRRIYTPSDFGVFSVFLSCLGIVVTLFSLRFDTAIVVPKEEYPARQLLTLSFVSAFLWFLVLFLVCLFFSRGIAALLQLPPESHILFYIFPFSVLFYSLYNSINYWLIRNKQYPEAGKNKIVRRSAEGAIQVVCGLKSWFFGLVAGDLFGNIINTVVGYRQALVSGYKIKPFSLKLLGQIAVKYKHFPLFNLIPNLLNSLSLLLPVLIVNHHYSQAGTGFFDLSRMVLGIPLALIATSLSQVLLQQFAELKNQKKEILPVFKKVVLFLLIGGGMEILFFFFWSEDLFSFIFGNEWSKAGTLTAILVFSYAVKFVVSPLSGVFIVFEKLKWASLWQSMYFIFIVALFFLKVEWNVFFVVLIGIDILAYGIYFAMISWVIRNYQYELLANYNGGDEKK